MGKANVTVLNNGPYTIQGDFVLTDANGDEYGLGERGVIALCRCGESTNKPFCDGSHNHHSFKDQSEARDITAK